MHDRRWEDKNFEAEQLSEKLATVNKASTKQGADMAEVLDKLTATAEALKHTGKHNEELLATLQSAQKANEVSPPSTFDVTTHKSSSSRASDFPVVFPV